MEGRQQLLCDVRLGRLGMKWWGQVGESQFGAHGKDREFARETGTRRAPCCL